MTKSVSFGANTVFGGAPAPAGNAPAPGGFGAAPAPSSFGGFGSSAPTSATPAFGAAPSPAPPPSFGGAFGAPSPAPSAFGGFGAPTPAPGGGSSLFGSSSLGGFGAAPSPGGFGAAPAPGGSLFGSSSLGGFGGPAPAPSLFGSPSPAPGGSMFGGFGAPAPGGFGQQQQQQQQPQQPQVPAQAALQAHMEAMNAAETQKIKAELSKLYAIYTGEVTPSTPSDAKKNFVSIVYNDLTQEQRQLQWLHGMGAGGNIMPIAPPKPPQVSEEDWYKAVVQNPDPMSYMPIALVGADALSARLSWQQDRANQLAKDADMIQNSHETVKDLYEQAYRRLEEIQLAHANHRKRLLNVMRKVEVVRCMNQPLQQDEVRAMESLRDINYKVRDVRRQIGELDVQAKKPLQLTSHHHHQNRRAGEAAAAKGIPMQDRERLAKMLSEHTEQLKKVSSSMAKDIRDVELIKQRVLPKDGGGLDPRFR